MNVISNRIPQEFLKSVNICMSYSSARKKHVLRDTHSKFLLCVCVNAFGNSITCTNKLLSLEFRSELSTFLRCIVEMCNKKN